MRQKRYNPNKRFLIGISVLAFAVICIVCLFTLLALRMSYRSNQPTEYAGLYQIELGKGFVGDSLSIYVNDSLLLNATIPSDTLQIRVKRFSEENTLFIVDNLTDKMTLFNLDEKGGRIILRKQENIISMTSMDW